MEHASPFRAMLFCDGIQELMFSWTATVIIWILKVEQQDKLSIVLNLGDIP